MTESKVAVVILNFNGKHFLEKFLPGIVAQSAPHQIFVADNGSSDGSMEYVKGNFPQVRIILNGANYGYAKGYNLALKQVDAEYFVLLNNDIEVASNWISPVISLMDSNKEIGACQPKILDHKNRNIFEYAGACGGYIDKLCYPFCRGRVFNAIEEDKNQFDNAIQTFWASGACLFIRSEAFWRAGAFDEDYFAHMEEIDLCWRLKNFGYKIFVQPASIVYHVGGGTLNKFSKKKTFLNFRNNLTTFTKNHPDKRLARKILIRMVLDGVAAVKFLLEGQPKHFLAVIWAHFAFYSRFPVIMRERKRLKNSAGFKFSTSHIYKGNIVWEYFILKKKKFNSLQKGFFS